MANHYSYLDVGLVLGNMSGGQLSLDLLSLPPDSPLAYDRIWESARLCLPKVWGAEYPHEEILDDVENYRGLSFLHQVQKLKLSVWRLGLVQGQGKRMDESRQRLWVRIEEMEQVCPFLYLTDRRLIMKPGVQRPSDLGRDYPRLWRPPSDVDSLPRLS